MFSDPKLFKMSQFFAVLTSSSLTPYYSYRAQEICSTSHLSIASRPAAGNTCVSMTKMRKMSPKTHQNDRFSSKFWIFSGSLRGACMGVLWCILMSWSSGNLPGMILDRFGITHFFMIFLKILSHKSNVERSFHPPKNNRSEHWWCQSKLK